ncbi:MAG: BTAD domain-containing putative transcriptional regulator, partial [Acidobacteriota bacterium]
MNHLTVRCLGGLEIRLDDRQITAFESHKVRALFAYLIVQRDRSFSREHLAALFWPEKSGAAARRNLRQAIYNLKSALGVTKNGASIILAQGGDLQFDAELDCWLDVDTFETSRQQGLAKGTVGPHQLTAAVALYRGDFLAGFSLKDSPDFELWQLAMQERLRDQALESISTLVENYLSRGEFRIGLQYARRWVGLDPLSEEAHRYLMRLHALCGQRTRSLAHYEELCETLASELGVEPLEETQELYEVLLKEQALPPPEDEEEEKGIGPLIPLVGRQDSYQALRDCWRSVLDQGSQMTLVEGEPGIGKMRLVKSFLDATGSQRLITILQGRCSQRVPTSFQPFAQVLRNAIAEDGERVRTTLQALDEEDLANLPLIVPELEDLLPSLPPIPVPEGPVGHRRLFGCIVRILEDFCRSPDGKNLTEPLILLLGDLQWACCETAELIEHLLARLPAAPVWIIATSCPDHPPGVSPILDRLRDSESTRASSIALERLDSAAIEELAASFVDDHQSVELAR